MWSGQKQDRKDVLDVDNDTKPNRIHFTSSRASVHQELFKSIDRRNWHCSKGALPLSLQNLLDTLDFTFISLPRGNLAVCAGANTDVGCNARYPVGVNSGVAIVNGLDDL